MTADRPVVAPATPAPATTGRARTKARTKHRLHRIRQYHRGAPLSSATRVFTVLAAVRIAGAVSLPLMVLSVGLSAAVVAVLDRAEWAAAGLRRFRLLPALAGTGLVVLAYANTVFATRAAFGRGHDNWTSLIPELFRQMAPGQPVVAGIAMVLCMGILVPLVEEICYRGVLYHAVERSRGPLAAIAATSAGWALVHLGDYGLNPLNGWVICGVLPSVFAMGVALGVCRAWTGSALASAVAQGTANLLLLAWVLWAL
ncbi:CPBP family intramembrane glutamic endopeptidase [Kitasatospora aureofaciens]|uniref:CPBP family intramembrane glutamic endopeptidase n=1 Tax=Kitasatospora aureofaciens TaxID=1894 RepID=UPI001C458181|nr:type II CAAX endopeptidase family protein [Kitasatospora aureofaciens]MBV6698057.1 CPBP family intramembrane metalloprotease [Kitasatospora aureofaciens]